MDKSSYSLNDPITITLTTENVYSQVQVTINGKEFTNLTDNIRGFTGVITMNGHVTYVMGRNRSVSSLLIEAIPKFLSNDETGSISSATANYFFVESHGVVYFINPPNNPAQITANVDYEVTIFSSVAFLEAKIEFNDTLYCNLGKIVPGATVSCTGKIPSTLPSKAQFIFKGRKQNMTGLLSPGPMVHVIIAPDQENISTAISNYSYYSSTIQYNYAVSAENFYAVTLTNINSIIYKPIGQLEGAISTVAVLPVGASILGISAYTLESVDYIWAIDMRHKLYCGTISDGLNIQSIPHTLASKFGHVSVGPTGVWIMDSFGNLYNNSSFQCNGEMNWINSGINGVDFFASGKTGVYYHTKLGIFQVASPTATPQPVPSDGPRAIIYMSASTLDDTLVVVDLKKNIWKLNGLSGAWASTSLVYPIAVSYQSSDLYVYDQDESNNWSVNHAVFSN